MKGKSPENEEKGEKVIKERKEKAEREDQEVITDTTMLLNKLKEASLQAEKTLEKNMEQLVALKITMELSEKDVQEKMEQLCEHNFLMKEEKRKESPAAEHDFDTK